MAVELRWLRRTSVPDGEAQDILQYRQTYIAPNMTPFAWTRFWKWSPWVEKWGQWREVKHGA